MVYNPFLHGDFVTPHILPLSIVFTTSKMGLGILDDPYLTHVPGTTLFRDDPSAAALAQLTKDEKTGNERRIDLSRLKHAKGKHSHIILVPQPSYDPNDPLNWPVWKKHLVCYSDFCCCLLAIFYYPC